MYSTYHDISDRAKLAELTRSMEQDGWQGMPLVADGYHLITGAHRYPAAKAAEVTPEVVDIRDIYPEWDTLYAEYGCPAIDEFEYVLAVQRLPAKLRDEYGIDIH